jgi:predicted ribosomally synthesized peptide with SipW-like signal peptide
MRTAFSPPDAGLDRGNTMSDDKPTTYDLSRRKALLGLGTIGAAAVGAGMGTSALFSDEESFTNNRITAGTTNLSVEMGLVEVDSSAPDALDIDFGETRTADGEAAIGIQVGDMKPGDCIILRTTVDVEDNPMYVGVLADDVSQDGGPHPEPEQDVDPDNNGDLAEALEITFGYDSDRSNLHDNSLEGDLVPDDGSSTVSLQQFLEGGNDDGNSDGYLYRGREGEAGDPPGGHDDGEADPTRVGDDVSADNVDRDKVTHFVEICLPAEVGNEVQGDYVEYDLVYVAEQVRNNPDPRTATDLDGSQNDPPRQL